MQSTSSIVEELTFLVQYANEDEATILTRALHLDLNQLYREAVEQAFIDEQLSREKAIATLGQERVEEIEYAKQALAEDVERGFDL